MVCHNCNVILLQTLNVVARNDFVQPCQSYFTLKFQPQFLKSVKNSIQLYCFKKRVKPRPHITGQVSRSIKVGDQMRILPTTIDTDTDTRYHLERTGAVKCIRGIVA